MKKLFLILFLLFSFSVNAAEFTTNYNLEIPSIGTRDWQPIISRDIISIDTVLKVLSEDTGAVSSVSEGVASPLVINPTSGAVLITMLSADEAQAGYIDATQYKKVNILSSDVNSLIIKANILSNDALVQDNKIQILSNDALAQDVKLSILSSDVNNHWGILTADAVIQNTKLQILSNDALIQNNRLDILSNDALTWKNNRVSTDAVLNTLRATTLSGDTLSVTGKYAFPTTIPTVEGSVISYDSTLNILKWGTIVGGAGGGDVSSVAEGVPSPLVVSPTTGAVLITMLSADATQAGYIDAVQYGKVNILSTDVGLLTTKVNIISTDSAVQEIKLNILSTDVNSLITLTGVISKETGIISSDVGLLTTKVLIISSEVGVISKEVGIISSDFAIQNNKIIIISNDTGDLKLKTTIISNDMAVITPKVNNLSNDVGLLKAPTYITQTSNAQLTNEQAIGGLSSGIMRVATTTGVVTSLGDILPIANGGTNSAVGYTTVSNDVGDLKIKTTIISNDSAVQDNKLTILSNDAVTWRDNRVSRDAVLDSLRVGVATGVSLDAADGILIIKGKKAAGNNENLIFDFETTANKIGLSSTTGVNLISYDAPLTVKANVVSADILTVAGKYAFPATTPTVTGSIISYDGTVGTFGSAFYDRGDPAANDYTQATLTTDGAFHDLDLSSIVPPGAKAVLLRVTLIDETPGNYIRFRKNGNSNTNNVGFVNVQVNGIVANAHITIPCGADRVVEYDATSTTFTTILVTVLGWFI